MMSKFEKGSSGNPTGKKPGTRNRTTMAAQSLLDGETEAITRKCVEMALDGDSTAMRLCFERIAPVRRGRAIKLELPAINSAQDICDALSTVVSAMAVGEVTPEEASVVADLIERKRRAIETVELERRIADLEQRRALVA